MIITYRPEFAPPWSRYGHTTTLALNRLSRSKAAAMVEDITSGKALPSEVLKEIVDKTDGVPLFVEELTKTVLESGLLKDVGDHYRIDGPLPSLAIPDTLQDSLTARLDRLGPFKSVAQIGAVIGREFPYDLLAAVAPLTESDLRGALERLVQSGLVLQRGMPPDASYAFKHALVQDTAYENLLKSQRRTLHERIARVLLERDPDITSRQPELIAQHFTVANLLAEAIPYWQRAGERASERAANREAVAHLSKALELLRQMPAARERNLRELTLLLALGPALMALKGYASPDVERTYVRARELSRAVQDSSKLFAVNWGLWLNNQHRGRLKRARDIVEEVLAAGKNQADTGIRLQAHHAAWMSLLASGEAATCCHHIEEGLRLYDPDKHRSHAYLYAGHDPGVCGYMHQAACLWLMGSAEQAVEESRRGTSLARRLAHPPSQVHALTFSTILHQFRNEAGHAREYAEAMIELCREHDMRHYLAIGTMLRGWSIGAAGSPREGIEEFRQGLDQFRATGAGFRQTYYLTLLADMYVRTGESQSGLEVIAEAETIGDRSGEAWWMAEIHRVKGELLAIAAAPAGTVESSMKKALAVARRQEVKALELRAATSLGRHWQQQGRDDDARALLAPIHAAFDEGFDTADLEAARALLDLLA
jgi:predicted ATPase